MGKTKSSTKAVLECTIKEGVLTDWKEIAKICRNGDALKKLLVTGPLVVYSGWFGYISWTILRLNETGFYMMAQHPVAAMAFGTEQLKGQYGRPDGISSNNPAQCVPHKFLNSNAPFSEWWTKSLEFECEPRALYKNPGFMWELPQDFIDCIKLTNVEMDVPDYEGGGTVSQRLRFFLPSSKELFEDSEDGTFFKMLPGDIPASTWWTRSPVEGSDTNVHFVNCFGNLSQGDSSKEYGVVPVCRVG